MLLRYVYSICPCIMYVLLRSVCICPFIMCVCVYAPALCVYCIAGNFRRENFPLCVIYFVTCVVSEIFSLKYFPEKISSACLCNNATFLGCSPIDPIRFLGKLMINHCHPSFDQHIATASAN